MIELNTNIIFLDIDGVLATNKQFNMNAAKFMSKNEWAKKLRVPYSFDKGCVEIFNDILTQTNSEIVLSSDWKFHWTLDQLDIIFKSNGVIKSPIETTKTDCVSMSHLERNRAHQINKYIVENDIEKYVIIDDLNIEKFYESIDSNFVRTICSEGLKQLGVKDKIINLLK